MNKFGIVLGVAAVVTLAGCKDPNYQHPVVPSSQDEVRNVDTTEVKVAEVTPVAVEPVIAKCTCPPGTKHTSPCLCGAPDCKCIVVPKSVVVADLSKPVEETTVYIVQNGDSLSKISKKFNVTIDAIKRSNSLKGDMIRIGQKLKLPGKFDVGVQKDPAQLGPGKTVKKVTTVYTGATKDYVVKNGDTLGSIAYGSGINIRQLKALNGLTSDVLKVGQKLKVPSEKVVKAAKPAADKKVDKAAPAVVADKKAAEVAAPVADVKKEADVPAPVVEEKKADEAPSAPTADAKKSTTTYVVQEGDDMTGVSIRWGVSAADIRELNNLAEGDQLVPGQIIKLPADAQQ